MPAACTIKKVYIFNSANSTVSAGVRVYQSVAGTAAPVDTGILVVTNTGLAFASPNVAVAAGATLAYHVTPGFAAGTMALSIGLLCQ